MHKFLLCPWSACFVPSVKRTKNAEQQARRRTLSVSYPFCFFSLLPSSSLRSEVMRKSAQYSQERSLAIYSFRRMCSLFARSPLMSARTLLHRSVLVWDIMAPRYFCHFSLAADTSCSRSANGFVALHFCLPYLFFFCCVTEDVVIFPLHFRFYDGNPGAPGKSDSGCQETEGGGAKYRKRCNGCKVGGLGHRGRRECCDDVVALAGVPVYGWAHRSCACITSSAVFFFQP